MCPATEHPSRWLASAAARFPDRHALIAGQRAWRFDELHDQVARAASSYGDAGAIPGEPTAIVSGSRLRIALGVLTGLHAGWPILPLMPGRRGIDDCLRTAGITRILSDDVRADARSGNSAAFPTDWLESPPGRRAAATVASPGDATLLYIGTSGTTDEPKVVRLGATNLVAAIGRSCERLAVQPGDCWLACLPMQHIGGVSIILRTVCAGAGAIVMERFDANAAARLLSKHEVTHVSVVPVMLAELVAELGEPPASLRCVLVGGGPLSAEVHAAATSRGWPLRISYGMTETCAHATIYDGAAASWRPGNVGTPMQGTHIELLDGDDRAGAGTGRIVIRGPQVMLGYAPEHLAADSGPDANAFVTADLGRFDEAGNLIVLGRTDTAFTSGGYLVYPESLEAVAAECPGVEAVAVCGLPDSRWEHRTVMVFAGAADAAAVADYCRERLEPHEQPREIVRWSAVPLAELGKPDRVAIRAKLMHR